VNEAGAGPGWHGPRWETAARCERRPNGGRPRKPCHVPVQTRSVQDRMPNTAAAGRAADRGRSHCGPVPRTPFPPAQRPRSHQASSSRSLTRPAGPAWSPPPSPEPRRGTTMKRSRGCGPRWAGVASIPQSGPADGARHGDSAPGRGAGSRSRRLRWQVEKWGRRRRCGTPDPRPGEHAYAVAALSQPADNGDDQRQVAAAVEHSEEEAAPSRSRHRPDNSPRHRLALDWQPRLPALLRLEPKKGLRKDSTKHRHLPISSETGLVPQPARNYGPNAVCTGDAWQSMGISFWRLPWRRGIWRTPTTSESTVAADIAAEPFARDVIRPLRNRLCHLMSWFRAGRRIQPEGWYLGLRVPSPAPGFQFTMPASRKDPEHDLFSLTGRDDRKASCVVTMNPGRL